MARPTTRPQDDEEDEIIDEAAVDNDNDDDEVDEQQAVPVVSDSRRRRQMKRGEYVAPEDSVSAASPTRKDRPTPSQRTETVKNPNIVVTTLQNINQYRKEVWDELNKVTWLSREETRRLATIVLVVTSIASAFLGLVSYLFGFLTQLIATQSSTIIAGIAAIVLIVVVAGFWVFREQLFGNRFEL